LGEFSRFLALIAKVGLKPEAVYNYLRANENTAGVVPMFSADGKDRGHPFLARLSHRFLKAVDGCLLIEDFVPGAFYGLRQPGQCHVHPPGTAVEDMI